MNLLSELRKDFPSEKLDIRETIGLDIRKNEEGEDEEFKIFHYTIFVNGEDSGTSFFIKDFFKEYDFVNNVGSVIVKNSKKKIKEFLENNE